MNLMKKIISKLQDISTLYRSLGIIMILLIILILYSLSSVFADIFGMLIAIIKPFAIGFMIAYILNPCVNFLRDMGMKRGLAIAFVYISVIFLVLVLGVVLLPAMIRKISELSAMLIAAAQEINIWLIIEHDVNLSPLFSSFIEGIRTLVDNLGIWQNALTALTDALGYFTSGVIYLAISLYMIAHIDEVKMQIKRLSRLIHPFLPSYLSSLDYYMLCFLKGVLVLMGIHLLEYGLMYFLVGHSYYKELAVLNALSVIIPYIGPLMSSLVGLLTGYGLPSLQFMVMLLLTLILFLVDSYVIMPRVYSSNTNTKPIWILCAIIIGTNLFGITGMVFAVPLLMVGFAGLKKIVERRT